MYSGRRDLLTHQRPDGSWPYGEQPGLQWVDGFHTGYVLEALLACERAGVGDVGPALERGLAFYRDRLFLADGTAKYYVDDVFPVDAQCVAQGIQTFALASLSGRDFQQPAWRVFDFAQGRMNGETAHTCSSAGASGSTGPHISAGSRRR